MADYLGESRTNFFQVAPEKVEAFKLWVSKMPLELVEHEGEGFCLLSNHKGGWPTWQPDDNDMEGVDFAQQISQWLVPGTVAIMIEVGNEKLVALNGYTCAAHANGELVEVQLTNELMQKISSKWPDAKVATPKY